MGQSHEGAEDGARLQYDSDIAHSQGSSARHLAVKLVSTCKAKVKTGRVTKTMSRNQSDAVVEEIREHTKTLPPLLRRQFVQSPQLTNPSDHVVRIMQWNILAQALALGKDNFVCCPQEALQWNTRKYRILEELLCYKADIICLQEVDVFSYINDNLTKFGYSGVFFPKVDSPCLYVASDSVGPNGLCPDGCAIFYKTSKYRLVQNKSVPLQNGSLPTNQVTIMALFEEVVKDPRQFVIAVTHLKAKKGHETLRHSQGCDLLAKVSQFAGDRPVVICGDFNATQEEPVYSAFDQSKLGLTSAYRVLNGQEPDYTTWKIRGSASGHKTEYCRTIDYIWVSKGKIEVADYLNFPTAEEVGPDRLPSFSYASDHFSLAVDLVFKS